MNLSGLHKWIRCITYRQKVIGLTMSGTIIGLVLLFAYTLRLHTYIIGDDPAACVNCHIMTPYYITWAHSSHGRDVTCNDCHVPHGGMNGLAKTPNAESQVPLPPNPVPEWLQKALGR